MSPVAQELEHLLPTDEDVAFYREHGWFNTQRIYSDDEVDDALEGVRRHHAGERDVELRIEILRRADWRPGDDYRLRINDNVALTNFHLRRFIMEPVLAAIAVRLAGIPQIRLWQSGIIHKEPQTPEEATIGWHTDGAYWQMSTSDRMLTAWIPLHHCDESMGTLVMIDGSHRWERNPEVDAVRLGRTFLGTSEDELEPRLAATGQPVRRVPMVLARGEVSFHHGMIVHGSGPNYSDQPRIAVTADFQPGDNRYRRVTDAAGNDPHHSNDRLCRKQPNGEPDYTDPDVFPVLWQEPQT